MKYEELFSSIKYMDVAKANGLGDITPKIVKSCAEIL